MVNHDQDHASKKAAQELVESMDGLSVAAALRLFALLEMGVSNSRMFHPPELERYFTKMNGLMPGSALNAIRLAKLLVQERVSVDVRSEAMQQTFSHWRTEAQLAGVNLGA